MDKLLEDALQAYSELGGEEYLRQHPELLERVLLYKLAKQVGAPTEIDISIEIPWLTKNRLAYKRDLEPAKHIEQSASSEALGTLLLGLDSSPPTE